jgi:putative transposase
LSGAFLKAVLLLEIGAYIPKTTVYDVRAVKTIRFEYQASDELSSLFQEFRLMCNDAIIIALREKPKNRFKLIEIAYPRLKEYGLHTHYILSACEIAYSAYKNRKRKSAPYVRRQFIKLDSQTYVLSHLVLRIPTHPRHFIYLTLKSSNYQLSFIDDPKLKLGSVTITDSIVAVALTKETPEVEPEGQLGIDLNERNVTWADSSGRVGTEDMSAVAELKEKYKAIRAKIAQRTSNDRRTQRRLLSKYGERERKRVCQAIHRVTRKVVEHAKSSNQAILMERLTGIRRRYRKGNGQGVSFRGRMNTWAFRMIQQQIDYKARWVGITVFYVDPRYTSRKCPNCDSSLITCEGRKLLCPWCGIFEDRDVVAAKNIMACVVPQARPGT